MAKKFLAVFSALVFVVTLGAGCGKSAAPTAGPAGPSVLVITDMCGQFPLGQVGEMLGKPVVVTESQGQRDFCEYYTTYDKDFYKLPNGKTAPGGEGVILHYENLNVANQKTGQEALGRKIETNDKIKMENFLAIEEDGAINSIYLVLDPNHFVSVDRSSAEVASEEEIVDFAAKVAEKLKSM